MAAASAIVAAAGLAYTVYSSEEQKRVQEREMKKRNKKPTKELVAPIKPRRPAGDSTNQGGTILTSPLGLTGGPPKTTTSILGS